MVVKAQTIVTSQTEVGGGTMTVTQPYVQSPLDKYGGRKFVITVAMFLMTFVALAFGWVKEDVYKYITYAIIIVYVGGNVVQKVGLNLTSVPKG